MLKRTEDELIKHACWGLCYLTNGRQDGGAYLLKHKLLPKLLELTANECVTIALPATRLIGDIVCGSNEQAQIVINAGGLISLRKLLESKRFKVRKEACWILANIAGGTPEQLTALFNADVLGLIVRIIKKDNPDVKREAIWAINMISSKVSAELIPHFLPYGIIEALCALLPTVEPIVKATILKTLDNFLIKWKEGGFAGNEVANKIEGCEGTKYIEDLLTHPNQEISKLSNEIIEKYFGKDIAEEMIDADT